MSVGKFELAAAISPFRTILALNQEAAHERESVTTNAFLLEHPPD
jgi:hypothetical protein